MGKVVLLLLIPLTLFGLSLKEAEEQALKNFYLIREKKLELREVKQAYFSALSELLPQIKLSLSYYTARRQDLTLGEPPLLGSFTLLKRDFYRLNLLLEQELLNPVKLKRLHLSRRLISLKEKELKTVKSKVLWEVRKAYINALKLKALIRVYRKQLQRVEQHMRNAERLYEEGVVPFKDLLETRVRLYEVRSKLRETEIKYRNALDYLSYLTGLEVKSLQENPEFPTVDGRVDENPELAVLREALKVSEEKEKLVKLSFLPSLSFSLLLQRTTETEYLPKNRYFISFSLNWLLLGGGKRFFELRKAKAEKERIRLSYRRKEEELKLKYRSLRRELEVVEEEIKTARERLKEAKENYRLALEKYENGLGTNAEVLDAEAYLTAAEENLKIREYEKLLKLYELMEVVGK